jgi:hypothetical protein
MDSQLTEKYKKEVSDILTKIGDGMGKTVIEKLQPEINTLTKDLDEFRKVVTFQKENNIEFHNTIKDKIADINVKQENVINAVTYNGESSNILLKELNKSVEIIPEKIQNGTDLLNQLSAENKEATENINNTINGKVLEEFKIISERLDKIESNKTYEIQLNKFLLGQEKTFKFIYILLFILTAVFITSIIILFRKPF